MAGSCETLQEELVDLEKMLSAVVEKRKTVPTECMEIEKEIFAEELSRLENAKVNTEEDEYKEKFKSISREVLQGLKELDSLPTLDDVEEAEDKLKKLHEKNQQINSYLEKRKAHLNNIFKNL